MIHILQSLVEAWPGSGCGVRVRMEAVCCWTLLFLLVGAVEFWTLSYKLCCGVPGGLLVPCSDSRFPQIIAKPGPGPDVRPAGLHVAWLKNVHGAFGCWSLGHFNINYFTTTLP
jgi:hypothetical protein